MRTLKKRKDEDDGGSAKGNDRRNRRLRKRWMYIVFYSFIGFLIVWLALMTMMKGGDYHSPEIFGRRLLQSQGRSSLLRSFQWTSTKKRIYRWSDPRLLPPFPGDKKIGGVSSPLSSALGRRESWKRKGVFRVSRNKEPAMPWEIDPDEDSGPVVDYTQWNYSYPQLLWSGPPSPNNNNNINLPLSSSYPSMETLGKIMKRWPQDNIDDPPSPILERLQHFDFQKDDERRLALAFRDAELPFKLYNVPEISKATEKWTDEYVARNYDIDAWRSHYRSLKDNLSERMPRNKGHCQEGVDNFFAFFQAKSWNADVMGPPPTLDNDWTFAKWAKHARYADRAQLSHDEPHYYWQANVSPNERNATEKLRGFVSRDLPSFSSPNLTFFWFDERGQQGIQCRFGERGVTAATHYDAGRNMIAMITGAKRYILGPPSACSKLGIVTDKRHPSFRHSLLNFGHMNVLDADEGKSMPAAERAWLEIARDSLAVETVLKAGEVLYVPSHWFHYITSLQKSAQCNTRSGREKEGTPIFGGYGDVLDCVGEDA